MDWKKGTTLQEGRSKKVYESGDSSGHILSFKNNFTLAGSKGELKIQNRGEMACSVSVALFQYLGSYHIKTHYLDTNGKADILVNKLEMIPVEFLVWNIASDDFAKRFGLKEGSELKYPVLECYLKESKLKYPMMNFDHITALDLTTPEEMQTIDRLCRKVNALLKSYFERRQFRLINLRLEFGRDGDKIILGDELTPECLGLWHLETGKKLDVYSEKTNFSYSDLSAAICG